MRSRNIKPGFFKNERLAELSPLTRLLFVGLWCMADREGRLEDRPKRIKAEILPYDNCHVASLLVKLEQSGFIHRYGGYIVILKFKCHQNPHINEKPSVIPAPGDIGTLPEDSGASSEPILLIPSSLIPSSLIPLNPPTPLDPLLEFVLQELPSSESTADDYLRTINRYRGKLTDEHIERIIAQLGNYTPKTPRPKLHLTLASWLSKEPRDPVHPSLTPFIAPDEPVITDEERAENIRILHDMASGIGRSIT